MRLCHELGCPRPPDTGGVRCSPCKADPAKQAPLYGRPHRVYGPTVAGKCEICGREDYDGIHMERG